MGDDITAEVLNTFFSNIDSNFKIEACSKFNFFFKNTKT